MKNRQGLTIAALIVAIIGLSIGFAAFSNTLTISSSASVNPSDENFIVQFSKYSDSDATGTLNPITPTASTSDYGENGLIPDSNKKKLQDLKATFTSPGQSVTYELYVRNTGQYVAYLKDLSFANAEHATSGETYKHCYAATKDSNNQDIAPANQATGTLVSAACNGISISVTIGTAGPITPESVSKSLGNQALSANGGNVQATITISYANNASYVDGPMEVEFGDITFTASSNQGSNQGGSEPTPSEPAALDVTGTYNLYVGDFADSIELDSDGTAILYFGEESMPTTYNYDDTNNVVTISTEDGDTPFNYYSTGNNKVLLFVFDNYPLIFTTNGSADFTTLSGTYTVPGLPTLENPEGTLRSYIFASDGTISGDNSGKYVVLNGKVYIDLGSLSGTYTPNNDFSVLTPDNGGESFTLQS